MVSQKRIFRKGGGAQVSGSSLEFLSLQSGVAYCFSRASGVSKPVVPVEQSPGRPEVTSA
jgi:hypothetical protein